jgi:DnaK suppressor protein
MSELNDGAYKPTDEEPFMNERQQAYFRTKLITWKNEILREARDTLEILQESNIHQPDVADRASSEADRAIELRAKLMMHLRALKMEHTDSAKKLAIQSV